MLTLIDHIVDNGTFRHFPGRIADDGFLRSVFIFQVHLEEQTRRTITLHPILLGIVESVAQNGAHGIFSLGEHSGHVI